MNSAILRSTWAQAADFGDRFVAHFYARLFLTRPDLRALFGTDMATQRKKIHDTLDLVVRGADNLEGVVPQLQRLGRMHRRFGVTVDMFGPVGEALVDTFAHFLDDWDEDAEATWTNAFTLVAGVMVKAYRDAEAADRPAAWDVLVLDVQRGDKGLVVTVDVDGCDLTPGTLIPVRLPDRAGTWREFALLPSGRDLLVPIPTRPDGVTLDLLSAQPGDHLWVAAPVDPVDQEAS